MVIKATDLVAHTQWNERSPTERIKEMSIEEKVGQLIFTHFNGETANDKAQFLIEKVKVGGIIYYTWANGLNEPKQVKKLSENLQEMVKKNRFSIPLFIGIDQEGGVVTRLKKGFTEFPGNKALAQVGNLDLAE